MKKIMQRTFNGFNPTKANPRPFGLFLGIILVISLIIGCSTSKGDMLDEVEGQNTDQTSTDDLYNAAQIVQSIDNMAACAAETQGYLYYIIDQSEFQYCNGTEYVTINLAGADGTNGTSGISIVWQGSLATAPASPQTNWAYYNTADNKSYIWDGDSWEILAQDGTGGGTVTDNGDGTVSVPETNLTWAKCSQLAVNGSNTYNSGSNDCSNGAAITFQYCDADDNSCNGGTDTGVLDGNGNSEAYDTCNNMTLAGRSWRVPTRYELEAFYYNTWMEHNSLFPNTLPFQHWLSTSLASTSAQSIRFDNGGLLTQAKTNALYVRCVSTGS